MVSTPDSISSIRKLLDSTRPASLGPLHHAGEHVQGAAQAHQGGEGGQQGDDGAAHPHPRQGQITDALDIADVDAVYNAV